MTPKDLIWCGFCEDRPAVGRMIVMRDESRDIIAELGGSDGRACDLHGRAWTGVPVAEHEDDETSAVLQYVHPDFEQVTEEHIQDFAGEKTCSECGDPTEPMPIWVAERVLRAHPDIVLEHNFRWEGICFECAHKGHCPNCADHSDDDDHPDGWQADPYLT